ncbi:MAG TPA: DUF1080 domain-containing protein [Steroidobacteraceae bacterium]|nr:DUF1080 domain-containing protein [Steroidobacteraceae bacterium]
MACTSRMLTSTAALLLAAVLPLTASGATKGFTSMFDGKTLEGWRGDMAYFTVRDGALTAGSEQDIPRNTYLIYDKPYADFELHYKYRWATETGNSGIQFRSGVAEGHFALAGMQANLTPLIPQTERFGMLYEELGDRVEMVLLGQRAEVTRRAAGRGGQGRVVRTVLATTNPREKILAAIRPYPEWNEVVLIAHGEHIVHAINGLLVFDAMDKDPLARRDGLLGIQVHAGKPMVLQIKDMEIKAIDAFPDMSRFKTEPGPAPEPSRTYKDSTKVAVPDVALPAE